MINPGDVVTVDFPGATGIKRRPAVIVSSDLYHRQRPDVIVGVLTTALSSATSSMDYLLQDWAAAGLHAPSAFRCYFATIHHSKLRTIGHLSDADWQAVRDCVQRALA